jgi:hypothetical protein
MDFNFTSKINMGIISTMILIILLSQSRFFNFLIDNSLGRTILLMFVLGISYIHKIFGVVAVLFIIIAFNQNGLGYLEGFQEDDKKDEKKKDEKKKDDKPTEGFNTLDREHVILKGKRSSELPVYSKSRTQDDSVEPSDKSSFNSSYTTF